MNHSNFSNTGTGTVCGTLLSILPNIHLDDLLQTVILAAIGASVSFIVTLTWKRVMRRKNK
jgi:hypothetical protein